MIDPCAINTIITGDPRFYSIAGSRLYPVYLPQSAKLPAATYQIIHVKPLYSLDANVNVTEMRLQLDAWAKTYGDCEKLAQAIFDILDNFSGTLSDGTRVYGIQLRNMTNYFEHEALIYRNLLEFNIQYADA